MLFSSFYLAYFNYYFVLYFCFFIYFHYYYSPNYSFFASIPLPLLTFPSSAATQKKYLPNPLHLIKKMKHIQKKVKITNIFIFNFLNLHRSISLKILLISIPPKQLQALKQFLLLFFIQIKLIQIIYYAINFILTKRKPSIKHWFFRQNI